MFLALSMQDYLLLRPQGPHQWRQTDCLSFALNYAQQDNSLLEPELHNLMSDGGESGKTIGEFPLLYFMVGKIWKITGVHEWIFRLLNFLIFAGGLYGVFQFLRIETQSFIVPAFAIAMIFTIPVLTFYAPNFLSNITAFSLVLMGWYQGYLVYKRNKWTNGVLMILLFALAGLLKITALISVLAMVGVFVVHLISGNRVFKNAITKQMWLLVGVGTTFILTVNISWYMYARAFNTLHGGWFTFNDLWPIWEMEPEQFEQTISFVKLVWVLEYFTPQGYWLSAISVGVLLVFFRSVPAFVKWLLLFIFLGCTLYLLLWFKALMDHDYYLINLYILPVFLWVTMLYVLHKKVHKNWISTVAGGAIATYMVVQSMAYSRGHLAFRYNGFFNDYGNNKFSSFFDITPYLRNTLGLTNETRIVTYADPSYSISLYLANQKGWPMKATEGADVLQGRIDLGAEYILVNDSSFYQIPNINKIPLTKVGQHKTVTIWAVDKSNEQ